MLAKDVYKQTKAFRLYLKTLIYGKVEAFSTKTKKSFVIVRNFFFWLRG